ncbi:MAG: type IV pilus modification protein PilV [Halothiobacillaceae bacterium]|nr:type IV pilus modification protein PilV [Halothiobacillaceae bacterium]
MNTSFMMNEKSQAGVGLVEVLIAIVVLSIGLLGLASLQTSSLKNSDSSMQRSMAIVAAYDLIDRIQAARAQGVNPSDYAAAMPLPSAPGAACNPPPPATVQGRDLYDWINGQTVSREDGTKTVGGLRKVASDPNNQNLLGPDACGGVACNGDGVTCMVRVVWSDARGLQIGGTTDQFVDLQVRFQ